MERKIKKAAHLFCLRRRMGLNNHIFVHRGREGDLTLLPYSFAFWGIGQRILRLAKKRGYRTIRYMTRILLGYIKEIYERSRGTR